MKIVQAFISSFFFFLIIYISLDAYVNQFRSLLHGTAIGEFRMTDMTGCHNYIAIKVFPGRGWRLALGRRCVDYE